MGEIYARADFSVAIPQGADASYGIWYRFLPTSMVNVATTHTFRQYLASST
jgi:hypothetical protein